ncbi:MAG: two-component system, cell cycle sensor histidine kinase and response regulator CckA [Rhodospirillaceae bacterium]|nr:two-component system, cell cycle sensor histidine kinase and response regulator CckA [Rhodospirillaceae bacterium]
MARILVVEDSPTQAEQLRLDLDAQGYEVIVAKNAEAALVQIDLVNIDMVISDVVMPGLSGYDLCRRIKGDRGHRNIPVLLLSSLSDPLDIVHGLECGADNYLTKPYEREQLLVRVKTVLDNRRLRQQAHTRITGGIEIMFLGRRFTITSDKEQILDLLMSTFEDIVRTNRNLRDSREALSAAKAELEGYTKQLEQRVQERTAELREREQQLAQAQAIAHLGGWRWSVGTDRVEWSDEMYRIYGVERESFEPTITTATTLIHADDRETVRKALSRTIAHRHFFDREFRILRPNGEMRHVWGLAHCSVDADGNLEQVLGINQDITERRQAERTALENAERYRQLVELSPDGVLLLKEERFVFFNPAALRILGASQSAEVIGRHCLDFVHRALHEQFSDTLQQLTQGRPQTAPIELKILRVDGTTVDAEMLASTFLVDGGSAVQVILRDISGRRQIEQQLQHAQRMEAVGQLTGGIAHDFNNHLGVIIGNLDLLLDNAMSDATLKSFAQGALDGALRGAELTQRLLAFSRKQPLQPKVIDLNSRLPQIATMLRRTLGEQITLDVHPEAGLWRAIADPSQIDDAVLNLAINARDAMPKGGTLTIETANATLDDSYVAQNLDAKSGDYVLLAVSDSGTGMPPEVLERVFEPFFTTKETGKGTGLGLSMVYGFVKQSKGHLKIYSEIGHGTTVKIYLPRAGGADMGEQAPAGAEPQRAAGHELILLVEDNTNMRAVATKQVVDLGYRTLEADTARQALVLLDQHPEVDLLFSDVVMPGGMTGYELAVEARRRRPGLKILLTSGYTARSPASGTHEVEGVQLLNKPYRKHDLATKLREILDQQ